MVSRLQLEIKIPMVTFEEDGRNFIQHVKPLSLSFFIRFSFIQLLRRAKIDNL